jgi:hypothetical protein
MPENHRRAGAAEFAGALLFTPPGCRHGVRPDQATPGLTPRGSPSGEPRGVSPRCSPQISYGCLEASGPKLSQAQARSYMRCKPIHTV